MNERTSFTFQNGGNKLSNVQIFNVELDSDLLNKFNTALSLKNENANDILKELISQYIVYAFKSEAFELKNKTNKQRVDYSSDRFIYRSKKNNIGQTDQIRAFISEILYEAKKNGTDSIDLRSGDIHRDMGLLNRMPSVCAAMETLEEFCDYHVIHDTYSKRSSTRVFRYYLK